MRMCLWAIQVTRWKTLSLTSTKKSQTPVCLLPITSLFLISNAAAFQQIFESVKTRKENKCPYTMPLHFVNFTRLFFKTRPETGKLAICFGIINPKPYLRSYLILPSTWEEFPNLRKKKVVFTSWGSCIFRKYLLIWVRYRHRLWLDYFWARARSRKRYLHMVPPS